MLTPTHLTLMSYNIQVGIPTQAGRGYVLGGWKHWVPHLGRMKTLLEVAKLIRPYDVVALQEIDAGSVRSNHINHIRFFAEEAGFPERTQQVTRRIGRLAQHAKGILSRYPLTNSEALVLPGKMPGRGVLLTRLTVGEVSLWVLNVHLSLGLRAQMQQLDFIYDLIARQPRVIVMGDFNLEPATLAQHRLLKEERLLIANTQVKTYPSWKPSKCLDYILHSPSLQCLEAGTIISPLSDHLPVWARLAIPQPEV